MDFDPIPLLKVLEAPVLALYGERDDRVPALRCAENLVALRRRDGRDVTVHVFPDTGHGLIQVAPPSAPFDWPRLPAGYLPVIAAWLQTRVLRPASVIQAAAAAS
jgi:pimeloyl-ACP methyl ester carboxylesterase